MASKKPKMKLIVPKDLNEWYKANQEMFALKVQTHYLSAKRLHPVFCNRANMWYPKGTTALLLKNARHRCEILAEIGKVSPFDVLDEEILEVREALEKYESGVGKLSRVEDEIYDCAAVLVRMLEMLHTAPRVRA